MLLILSSIPITVRAGFDVQDLPHRASTLNEDSLKDVFGGSRCIREGNLCSPRTSCCYPTSCGGWLPRCRKG